MEEKLLKEEKIKLWIEAIKKDLEVSDADIISVIKKNTGENVMYSMRHQLTEKKLEQRKIIPVKLKAYRFENGTSQDELAEKMSVTRRQIIRWESGECYPNNVFREKMEEMGIL